MKRITFTRCVLTLAAVMLGSPSPAQDRVVTDTLRLHVYFRQGESLIRPEYRQNGTGIDRFAADILRARSDSLAALSPIHIRAGASPEGSHAMNKRLSEKRAAAIVGELQRRTSLPDSLFQVSAVGIDWETLIQLVEASDSMQYRDEMLNILRNTPVWVKKDGRVVDSRKRQMEMLRGGRPYFWMYRNLFPEMRSSGSAVSCVVRRLQPVTRTVEVHDTLVVEQQVPAEPDTVVVERTDTVVQTVVHEKHLPVTIQKKRRNAYMAFRTNLLYDALAIPNAGLEFSLGGRWSLGADWMYSWWNNDHTHRYWRTYGGGLTLRRYFGRRAEDKPLQGQHAGIYAGILTYDFETGGRGYLGDRWSYTAGLEYGYSLPVAHRLNIDFSLGLGYMGGQYKEYLPMDTHYVWQATKNRHWFGPTKAEVSLVWLIGRGNTNRKGGNR